MIYWHVDKSVPFIQQNLRLFTIPARRYMVISKHDTEMNMDKTYTDTHGQVSLDFAVSHLLGFELRFEFKIFTKQKFFYPDARYSQREVWIQIWN